MRPSAIATRVTTLAKLGLLEVIAEAAAGNHVTVEDILGRGRTRTVANARREIWCVLGMEPYGLSLHETARLFGVHHTSVLHARKSDEARAEKGVQLALAAERREQAARRRAKAKASKKRRAA